MIEFSEHATHTGWNDAALYGEFYRGLAERIKISSCRWNAPQRFNNSKTDALRCDSRYWERQGEKGPSTSRNRQSAFAPLQPKHLVTTGATTDTSKPAKGNTGSQFGTDGKLTEVERERRRVQGTLLLLCPIHRCGGPRLPQS